VAYFIDTNIAIHARDGTEAVLHKFAEQKGAILMSALSLAELQRGLYKNPADTNIRRMRLDVILRHIPVLPFDDAAARAYGGIVAQCGWAKGRDFDRMIAAHAIATASILVTNNVSDFSDIPGLLLENWATR
jgi:tRNA(fMet)-specific endonuclease VapC